MSAGLERLAAALADRYRIERELGQGGMATVYLAEDLRHRRRVALKVLKPELAAVIGADRFLAEITTTAALQHPHILPLHDSGAVDGTVFYVMPFAEGESLRDRIAREKQLPIADAVRIAREVASALDYAHRHGVVHRDIKPENVLLHDGRAVVADFGIALAASRSEGGTRMTETGMSLGTPHYMSPEQAMGERDLDGRADVYALGCVLYEMLAGEPPFTGPTAQAIVAKVMTSTPEPLATLRRTVPAHVTEAVMTALEKLPADRFASAGAFDAALANPAFAASATGKRALRSPPVAWRQRAALPALALAGGGLALAATWALNRPSAQEEIVSRYYVTFPEGQRIGQSQWTPMAVSPDGSTLVYVGESGRLLVRRRDALDAVELPGTDEAFNPFFSPDGSRVGFMSGAAGSAHIKVASLAGGPPVVVTSTRVGGPGAAWGHDGFIYFDASGVGPLMRVPQSGGVPQAISVLDSAAGELQHNWPSPLPNGRGLLMTLDRGLPGISGMGTNDIAVIDLATGRHRVLVRGIYARYAASGHILYVTADRVLMGVPFDQDRMVLTGTPVALVEGINIRMGGRGVDVAVSEEGTLWYSTGSAQGGRTEILWATRTGNFSEVDPGWTGNFRALALSPDGTRLAVSVTDVTGEHIWVKELGRTRGPLSKVTFERSNFRPAWHPDGRQVVFVSSFVNDRELRAARADGSGAPTILRKGATFYEGSWSRDGRWLVFGGRFQEAHPDIYGIRPGRDSVPVPLVATPFSERHATISPDGRWMLYEANPSGEYEAYVRPFPNTAESLTQVSTAGGQRARWSADGREIFFADAKQQLVRVAVLPGPSFAVGEPSTLFSLAGVADWDVAPDGRRFIVIRERAGPQSGRLVVVENFFQELRQRSRGER